MVRTCGTRNGPQARAADPSRRFRGSPGKIQMIARGARSFPLAALFAIVACVCVTPVPSPAQTAESTPKTIYYLHGRIYTNDPQQPWASAMAITGDKIRCIGSIEHILLDCGGSEIGAEVVQLKGGFVMPGFNDAHVHLGGAGADLLTVQLNGTDSVAKVQKRLADAVAQHKAGEWIAGSGWDHTLWPDKKFPNKGQLDVVAPRNPVLLT